MGSKRSHCRHVKGESPRLTVGFTAIPLWFGVLFLTSLCFGGEVKWDNSESYLVVKIKWDGVHNVWQGAFYYQCL